MRETMENYIYSNEIVALIPARSGSKTLPHKNVRPISGRPLLAWSIQHAKESSQVDRIIVSTDSEEYAKIARQWGADVPFIRPANISGDTSTDFQVFSHALNWLFRREGVIPEFIVQLRPTYPMRPVGLIDQMIRELKSNTNLDSIRTVSPSKETPYKMWRMDDKDKSISPLLSSEMPEHYNLPRQVLPKVFAQNACVDVVRSRVIVENKSMSGRAIGGFVMENSIDIDTPDDFVAAQAAMLTRQIGTTNENTKQSHTTDQQKTFCVDIDGVLAQLVPGNDYSKSAPIRSNIEVINNLFDRGYKIVLFTARGYVTEIDWSELTAQQMREWGVKYHELKFGKPAADYYIDDRLIDIDSARLFADT